MLVPPGHTEPPTLARLVFPETRLTSAVNPGRHGGRTFSWGLEESAMTQTGTGPEALAKVQS